MAAITVFNPEYWSAVIDRVLHDSLVFAGVANTNVVRTDAGDKMHILGETAISVTSTPATISYSTPTGTDTEFTYNVDQTGAFTVNDIDIRQSEVDWQSIYADSISQALGDAVDAACLSDHASWTNNYETGTTAWTLGTDGSHVPKLFAKLNQVMNEANLPQAGRYFVGDPEVLNAIEFWLSSKGSDLGDTVTQNGYRGRLLGIDVLVSNNLTTVTGTPDELHCLAGVRGKGVAFGQQINPADVEMLRDKDTWATYVRARALAGYKVYNANHVFDVVVNKDSMLS